MGTVGSSRKLWHLKKCHIQITILASGEKCRGRWLKLVEVGSYGTDDAQCTSYLFYKNMYFLFMFTFSCFPPSSKRNKQEPEHNFDQSD